MSLSEPRVLDCPSCSQRHVDRGEWATKPHRTHLCEFCGYEWRPFPYYTVGVAASPVEIERDALAQQLAAARSEWGALAIRFEDQRAQLAAAREECRDWQDAKRLSDEALGDALDERDSLRRQLAAIEAPSKSDVEAVAKVLLKCGVVGAHPVARAAYAAIAERARGGQG